MPESDRTVSDKRDTRKGGAAFPSRPEVRGFRAAILMTDAAETAAAAGDRGDPRVASAVLERARTGQISLVRFLYADHGGIIRGKATHVSGLEARMASGIGHTVAMMAMNMLDQLQPVEGMGPVGEVRIVPNQRTFVPLPYAPGAAAMASDLVRPDGQPWEACSRTFLKQAIAELAAEGYAMSAAFEPEFTLGQREPDPGGGPDRMVPADDSLCYSSTGFQRAHGFVIDLVQALEAQHLEVEHYPRLGHGRPEVVIRHAPALRAADNHLLYRETVRGVAFGRGLGQPGPEAHRRPGRERHPPARVPVRARPGRRTYRADRLRRRQRSVRPVGDRLPLHRRPARAPAGAHRADLWPHRDGYHHRPADLQDQRLHRLRMDNQGGGGTVASVLRGDPGRSVNLKLKPSDSQRQPVPVPGRVHLRGPGRDPRAARSREAVNVDPATLSDAERARLGARRTA